MESEQMHGEGKKGQVAGSEKMPNLDIANGDIDRKTDANSSDKLLITER